MFGAVAVGRSFDLSEYPVCISHDLIDKYYWVLIIKMIFETIDKRNGSFSVKSFFELL